MFFLATAISDLACSYLSPIPYIPNTTTAKSIAATVLLFLTAPHGVSAVNPSTGCGNDPKLVSANSAKTALTMTVNTKSRQYYVKLADNYDKSHAYRLIYTPHTLLAAIRADTSRGTVSRRW
jgi:hypothetical protein